MGMELPIRVLTIPCWRAMPAHRIWKRSFEQIVILGEQVFEDACQPIPLGEAQVWQMQDMPAR